MASSSSMRGLAGGQHRDVHLFLLHGFAQATRRSRAGRDRSAARCRAIARRCPGDQFRICLSQSFRLWSTDRERRAATSAAGGLKINLRQIGRAAVRAASRAAADVQFGDRAILRARAAMIRRAPPPASRRCPGPRVATVWTIGGAQPSGRCEKLCRSPGISRSSRSAPG